MLEQTMRLPQAKPASIVTFYSDAISHFDGFIPCNPGMRAQFDMAKAHYTYTYHDGRLAKCEFFDASGKRGEYYPVWNNSDGAPVLSADFGENGDAVRYLYAKYDASGKIHLLYHFDGSFELDCYDEFTYEGRATRKRTFGSNSRLSEEKLYENGALFSIINGEKRKVANVDRIEEIRSLVRFGLKPIYPGY